MLDKAAGIFQRFTAQIAFDTRQSVAEVHMFAHVDNVGEGFLANVACKRALELTAVNSTLVIVSGKGSRE